MRFDALDGMRGIASLLVVSLHLVTAWFPSLVTGIPGAHGPALAGLSRTPLSFLWAGHLAVMLFFLHSGFVLSNGFFATGNRQKLGQQAAKRVIRLGLPVAAALFSVGVLFWTVGMHNNDAAGVSGSGWLTRFYIDGPRPGLMWSAFGGALLQGNTWWMGPLWTIHIEFFGSFVVFGLLALFGTDRRRNLAFSAVGVWALLGASDQFGLYVAPFALGVLLRSRRLGRLQERPREGRPTHLRSLFVGAALVGAVYFGSWPDEPNIGPWYSLPFSSLSGIWSAARIRSVAHLIAAAAIFWLVLNVKPIRRFLEGKHLQFLGRLSFSIYLVHWPVLMCLGTWMFSVVTHRSDSLILGAAVGSLGTVLVTFAAAWAFMVLVDRPSIRLAANFARWWSSSPPETVR